ncbi:MAG: AmmeMemoRadiSam system radical SAM enzyme, partial [Patescibacteria group bacterium]
FSLGTFGCNFGCEFCQNWEISQTPKLVKTETIKKFPVSQVLAKIKKFIDGNSASWLPEKIVETCLAQKITAIAFTYSEPTIFAEYAADTMKLAKRHFLRGVFVSSGYESRETLDLLHDYIDAYNIDLKGATDAFYQRFCHTHLAPVLETIMEVVKRKKWLEVTTLLIPEANTSGKDLRFISRFLASLSRDIPWHVTAFYPHYKMADGKATDWEMLKRAWEIGKEAGLHFVYTGNIPDIQTQSTFCPSCSALLIKRKGFTTSVVALDFKKGRCQKCGGDIAGVWT